MDILERKRREEEYWKQELEKRWMTIEDCLEFVESREDGLGTCGMEERQRRQERLSEKKGQS